jgi:secreted trypsin-like serine protease
MKIFIAILFLASAAASDLESRITGGTDAAPNSIKSFVAIQCEFERGTRNCGGYLAQGEQWVCTAASCVWEWEKYFQSNFSQIQSFHLVLQTEKLLEQTANSHLVKATILQETKSEFEISSNLTLTNPKSTHPLVIWLAFSCAIEFQIQTPSKAQSWAQKTNLTHSLVKN